MGATEHHYRISDLASNERPRERLKAQGAAALSTAELLAVLLRTGLQGENAVALAQRLLQSFGGLPGLQRADFAEMEATLGLGEAKTATIKAAIELGRRLHTQDPQQRLRISSPADAAALLQYEMSALEQEHLRAILLSTRNEVIEVVEIYRGSLNSAPVRIADVFKPAIRKNAAALILAHNHPSGDPTPSPDDVALTKAIREAGVLLGVELLDHVVIGQGRFVSLKEKRLGF
ncbi:MAG: DNA repair protein RadC [Anaerolineales bacterium]|jgi:DNA repair protein RadC|nr:DNA repair protein RadC [Anaerolineales bacterium]MCW5888007.1 DNA repair protein RadC [Anaerolineales bacterium]